MATRRHARTFQHLKVPVTVESTQNPVLWTRRGERAPPPPRPPGNHGNGERCAKRAARACVQAACICDPRSCRPYPSLGGATAPSPRTLASQLQGTFPLRLPSSWVAECGGGASPALCAQHSGRGGLHTCLAVSMPGTCRRAEVPLPSDKGWKDKPLGTLGDLRGTMSPSLYSFLWIPDACTGTGHTFSTVCPHRPVYLCWVHVCP